MNFLRKITMACLLLALINNCSDDGDAQQPQSNVPVSGISMNSNAETVYTANTIQLTATIMPSNATNKDITWSTTNDLIASVNQFGLVTGISEGTSTITATTVDGNKTDNCLITVPVPFCGNLILELGEECDDGNNTPGDGCNATCRNE